MCGVGVGIMLVLFLVLFSTSAFAGVSTRFGVITDIHHSDKEGDPTRIYLASTAKLAKFVRAMIEADADFIIELGDLVDALEADGEKGALVNLREVESIFKNYPGPSYHVLGNHEFENLTRREFLENIDNSGIEPGRSYYSFECKGIHYIVVDADYTVAEPHRPFGLDTADNPYWTWRDAWMPEAELSWLKADLAQNKLPVIVFTHQLLHREKTEDHTLKNADVVRSILESDGKVIAVFSGHDHAGDMAEINGINYFVLRGNVGLFRDWNEFSCTGGSDSVYDNQFALIEVEEDLYGEYRISVKGSGYQYSTTVVVRKDWE